MCIYLLIEVEYCQLLYYDTSTAREPRSSVLGFISFPQYFYKNIEKDTNAKGRGFGKGCGNHQKIIAFPQHFPKKDTVHTGTNHSSTSTCTTVVQYKRMILHVNKTKQFTHNRYSYSKLKQGKVAPLVIKLYLNLKSLCSFYQIIYPCWLIRLF